MEENEKLPDQPDENGDDRFETGGKNTGQRRRRRVRVRKRIRIKKKSDPKKKIKKLAEKVIWVVIIAGFITTIIIMMRQLDTEKYKASKKKKASFLDIKKNVQLSFSATSSPKTFSILKT